MGFHRKGPTAEESLHQSGRCNDHVISESQHEDICPFSYKKTKPKPGCMNRLQMRGEYKESQSYCRKASEEITHNYLVTP